eukprot:m.240834 g.240834  ORF g.240834 m.240834 type:complete len:109 (-) comp23705_c0_seq1:25-351(-)
MAATASIETVPSAKRHQRACVECKLVKTEEQFLKDGCENCEPRLRLAGSDDRVAKFTTKNFFGMIALMDPAKSWVGRWQGINTCVPGVYAMSVNGRRPAAQEDEYEED